MRRVWMGLVLLAACKQIGDEIDEEFLPDKSIRVGMESPLVVGETGYGAITDACSASDDDECETDEWMFESATVTGALVGVGPTFAGGSMISAVAKKQPGEATLTVTAMSGGARSSATASVMVMLPDEVVVAGYCRNAGDAPYLVPPDARVLVTWSMRLQGQHHLGDTGEVHAEAPLLTFVEKNGASAWFMTPSTGGTIEVRSNLGPSRFEYTLYDPAALSLVLAPKPQSNDPPDRVGFTVMGHISGRPTCNDPGDKLVETETPAVCMLRDPVTAQPVATYTVTNSYFQVIRIAAGTCRLRATHGTTPPVTLETAI